MWVIPLAIYLLSFVLVFRERPWYPRLIRRHWPEVCLIGLLLFSIHHGSVKWLVAVLLHLPALFVVCLVCHGELHRARPSPERLS